MRIAVNATYHLHGGSLTHLQNILGAWCRGGVDREHDITLFIRAESVGIIESSQTGQINVQPVGGQKFSGPAKLVWEQSALPGLLRKAHADVLLCPGNIVPVRSSVPSVVMFRNSGPLCDSITRSSVGNREWAWFRALGGMMRLSARVATRVIFVSNYFKELYAERFGFPTERGDVIYHGRDALTVGSGDISDLAKLGVREPYILSVSHLLPYKNFPALIEGFASARAGFDNPQTQLVLAGIPSSDSYLKYLRDLITRHSVEDSILLTGGVPHQTIGTLLENCQSFVFQSTCENCPNALIEALSAGVPIACSNAGVMPEIAGDAALYFDPYDPQDISRALKRINTDSAFRDSLRAKSQTESQKFPTWDQVGQMTLDSLVRAAEGSRSSD